MNNRWPTSADEVGPYLNHYAASFAGYRGRADCGWRGQWRRWPWEAEADEIEHLRSCPILNLDLRKE